MWTFVIPCMGQVSDDFDSTQSYRFIHMIRIGETYIAVSNVGSAVVHQPTKYLGFATAIEHWVSKEG